jgi:hypothetical protein
MMVGYEDNLVEVGAIAGFEGVKRDLPHDDLTTKHHDIPGPSQPQEPSHPQPEKKSSDASS